MALAGNSQTAMQYFNKGIDKVNLKDYNGAIIDLTKAIAINPKYEEAYVVRAEAKYNLENYKGAIADLTDAIDINPKCAEAYYNRGIAKKELRDIAGEIADYSKAIELKPNFEQAYYARGQVYNNSFKDFDGKIHGYTDSIENNINQMNNIKDIENLQYYFNNGSERIPVKEDYIDAMIDFSKVIEINPINEKVYENRGEIKYNLKDYRGAITDLQKSCRN